MGRGRASKAPKADANAKGGHGLSYLVNGDENDVLDDEEHPDDEEGKLDDSMEDDCAEVFMALFIDKGHLGVAVYDALTTKLKTAQIPVSTSDLTHTIQMLKTQIEPRAIVISTSNYATYDLNFLASDDVTEVCHRKACKAIACLRIGTNWELFGHALDETTEREIYKYLGSFFDFDSLEMIRAVGALLMFLSSEKIVNQLETSTTISVLAVEKATLDGVMLIDSIALKSLHIFNEACGKHLETHSYDINVFALLDNTMTKSGKTMLRQWMLKPLTRIQAIEERQDVVEFFVSSEQNDLANSLVFSGTMLTAVFYILR
ncbi:hypothetical protein ACHHYP_11640 [Achlya hypogyna]|uniref:DNA mismatch repair protein MutS core domain-containing protein n=1 Tax=Achlya hypogyna TaxID=1202772 RepID=A0A1V9YIU0_ACHHY|nr:hypothetical protein ACHHYP_11640 [Achlya hypogyna]